MLCFPIFVIIDTFLGFLWEQNINQNLFQLYVSVFQYITWEIKTENAISLSINRFSIINSFIPLTLIAYYLRITYKCVIDHNKQYCTKFLPKNLILQAYFYNISPKESKNLKFLRMKALFY